MPRSTIEFAPQKFPNLLEYLAALRLWYPKWNTYGFNDSFYMHLTFRLHVSKFPCQSSFLLPEIKLFYLQRALPIKIWMKIFLTRRKIQFLEMIEDCLGLRKIIPTTRSDDNMKTKDQKTSKEPLHQINLEDTIKKGLPSGWTRTTMVIREDFLEKLKDVAYWERANVKDLLDELLEKFFSSRETKPRPKERKKILG